MLNFYIATISLLLATNATSGAGKSLNVPLEFKVFEDKRNSIKEQDWKHEKK